MEESNPFFDSEAGFSLSSFDPEGIALVFGSSGGIGSAFLSALTDVSYFKMAIGFSRKSSIPIDITDELFDR